MWEGTPCLEKTWRRKSFANSGDVTLSVGMNMHCFDSQSTTTRIVVYPKELGSCSMKSIEMEFHGFSGIGSCLSKPKGLCLGTFTCAQVVQEETYSLTNVLTPGQVYSQWMSSKVWFCLKCLESRWSGLYQRTQSWRLSASGTWMWSSRHRNPSQSMDQWELEGSDMDRCMEANGLKKSANKMSLWSCLVSYIVLAWRTRAARYVALRGNASCSWVKMGWKLCGLMQA